MPANENLSSISCEICRQRKCKCDRKLPYCSNCSNDPSRCAYPESGRRGLPLGYLNRLEQRLAETETALYGALVTLRSMSPAAVVQASAKTDGQRQKSGRMEEWAQYPLQDWTGMERWMTGVSDKFMTERYPIEAFGKSWGRTDPPTTSQNSDQARSPADGETQGASSAYAGQPPGDDHVRSSHDIHFRPGRMSFSACSQDAVVGSDVATGGEHTDMGAGDDQGVTGHSRAEELSESKSSIYF